MKKLFALAVVAVMILGAGCSSNTTTSTGTEPSNPRITPSTDRGNDVASNSDRDMNSDGDGDDMSDMDRSSTSSETSTTPSKMMPASSTMPMGPMTKTSTSTTKMYTMVEVKAAGTPDKCWTTIEGKVYDLTLWEKMHPGKEPAILKLCGIDGTTLFEKQHGGQEQMLKALSMLQIGVLKK